jgi:phosphohistidine phosphatase
MKTVYLLRHAKSSWDHPDLPDHDRPLAPRGQKAAPHMAEYLRAEGLTPQRVLCSTATRARETWDAVGPGLASAAPDIAYRRDVYDADDGDLLAILRGLPDAVDSVMVVGHNPTLEDLAHGLAGGGDAAALARMGEKYPTCALAELQFAAESWSELRRGAGRLVRFVRPKDL